MINRLMPIATLAALMLAACQNTVTDSAEKIAETRDAAADEIADARQDANDLISDARQDYARTEMNAPAIRNAALVSAEHLE